MIWIFDLAEDRNTNIRELAWPGASSSRCHAYLKPRIDLECYSSTMLSLTLARSMKNKTGSHQCTRAVCSIVAGIRSTLTPRCIDALFGVRIPFQSLVQSPIQIPVRQSSDPVHVYTGHRTPVGNWYPKPIYPATPETPGLSILSFWTVSKGASNWISVQSAKSATRREKKKTKPILWLGAFGPSNKKSVYSLLDPALKSETHLLEFSIVTYVVKNQIRWVLIY